MITKWLATHDTDPITNETLGGKELVADVSLRMEISEWRARRLLAMSTKINIPSSPTAPQMAQPRKKNTVAVPADVEEKEQDQESVEPGLRALLMQLGLEAHLPICQIHELDLGEPPPALLIFPPASAAAPAHFAAVFFPPRPPRPLMACPLLCRNADI